MAVLGGIMAGVTWGGFLGLSWLATPLVGDLCLARVLTNEMLWLLLLAVCIAVISCQYLTHRSGRSLTIAFSGILICLYCLSGGWFLGAS